MAAPKNPNREANAAGGRKSSRKGIPNKRSQEVVDRLKELGCDPLELSAKIALGQELDGPHPSLGEFQRLAHDLQHALEKDDTEAVLATPGKLSALIDEHLTRGYVSMDLRSTHIRDLMQYRHPKRKAVEVTGKDGEDLIPTINPELLDETTLRALVKAMATAPEA